MYVEQWTIGSVLSAALERFKKFAAPVLIAMIVTGVITGGISLFGNVAQRLPMLLTEAGMDEVVVLILTILVQLFFGVVNFLVQTWFGLGMLKVYLKAARDEEPSVGDLFSVGPIFLTGLLANLVVMFAVLGGLAITWILLWIPLIIMGLGFYVYKYLIVDQELGPIECLKESWRLTHGEKWDLFLWGIVVFFINLAGFCCCIVGLLVTAPLTAIATTLIYDNMVQRKGRADGSEHTGTSGGSGGGYGSFGDGSHSKPPPASRATTDGDAPLMGKD
jgi:hypothetical protein